MTRTAFERKTKIESSKVDKSVKALHKLWVKGDLNFDLAIQRGEVWTNDQKTKLIFSILYGYFIPSVIVENRVNDQQLYFLDGKQRITSIMKFIDGAWALGKSMPEVYGQSFSGCKFKDLPEEVQDVIFDKMINIVKMENMTEEERDTQFVFLNMGTELSQMEKTRAMHSHLIEGVNRISGHQFLTDDIQLTGKARDRFVDQELILQIAMLFDYGQDSIKGFGSAQIRNYVMQMKEEGKVLSDELVNKINKALDYMTFSVSTFTDVQRKKILKKIHVPIIAQVAVKAEEENVKPADFGRFLIDFLDTNYSVESVYGIACQSGSSKKDNVLRRINEMTKAFQQFDFNKNVEEVQNEEEVIDVKEDVKEDAVVENAVEVQEDVVEVSSPPVEETVQEETKVEEQLEGKVDESNEKKKSTKKPVDKKDDKKSTGRRKALNSKKIK